MSQDPRHIRIADFSYPLPQERIAKFPLKQRDSSKLLIYKHGEVTEDRFSALPDRLPEGHLMVFNNTRVIQARLRLRKATGALIEVFCLEPAEPADYAQNFQQTHRAAWLCLIGNLKKWKEGALCRTAMVRGLEVTLTASRGAAYGTSHRVDFAWNQPSLTFADILEAFGSLPIPPYLNREAEESDKVTYQTVYSRVEGSVAAPTAGLHFTPEVLGHIHERGIETEELTLHVGAGTFKPVKSEEIQGHEMHTEHFAVTRATIERLLAHHGRAIAVGTTSVRALESLYHLGISLRQQPEPEQLHVGQWQPYDLTSGEPSGDDLPPTTALEALLAYMDRHGLDVLHATTQIIIAPGYRYRIVEAMVTNLHQPQSTLLLLVSAFVNGDWRRIYDYALAHDFRFLSYGDACLLIP